MSTMRNPVDIDIVIEGSTHNLEDLLEAHYQFKVNGGIGSELDLSGQDLHHVVLCNRDLRDIDFTNTNLFNADVMNADFRGANLTGANIDFAQLSISCKSLYFTIGDRNAKMLLYMVMGLMDYSNIDTSTFFTPELYEYLEDSHVVTEHGLEVLRANEPVIE